MIQANKANLVTDLSLRTLDIRQYEMDYWMGVFNKLGTIASTLGGFASTNMLIDTGFEGKRRNQLLLLSYILAAGSALGFNLVLFTISTLVGIWAPGKALRGEGHESMEEAIRIMEDLFDRSLFFFLAGLLSYFLSSILAVFWLFDSAGAFIIFAGLVGFLLVMGRQLVKIYQAFVPSSFRHGGLKGNPAPNIGQTMNPQDPRLRGQQFQASFVEAL
ncbi:unnamed protein product [Vitrella brassicaformis CCMP3155]|uniref:Uncharacterized protein n=2 Tax=Vitrella brassicaformis TaxID=1169539 RepID=A0A0G4ETD2_VITBC|nr:unnamed protein product [Vitrella brassicaformis CCMP3155]|mmetsp:Transcript_12081/g.28945  ORF Transcript_12081/g.28945 Transcript_12081/m.28945 type:complete len:217 (+) Transcript_12081:92-742(+)|eukprot:CEM01502.1 unnamed protein product [Vitrella brassicaformis CCMP3155]